jgi:transglutaminase-like putative cysteine protease
MAKADHLIKSEQRGVYKLTQKGRAELDEPHAGIDKSRDIQAPQPPIPVPSKGDGQPQKTAPIIPQVPEAAKALWAPEQGTSEGFWMVYVQDRQMPTVQHKTYEIAEQEAERLARKEGKAVYLLKAVAKFELELAPVNKKRL